MAAVKSVDVLIPPVEINPVETAEGSVTFLIPQSVLKVDALADDEQIWGIDGATGAVAVGKLDADGNVYFTAGSFSPWTFVKVKVEKKAVANLSSRACLQMLIFHQPGSKSSPKAALLHTRV